MSENKKIAKAAKVGFCKCPLDSHWIQRKLQAVIYPQVLLHATCTRCRHEWCERYRADLTGTTAERKATR